MLVKTWEKIKDTNSSKVFFIKTLRIYDKYNAVVDEILTE